MTSKTWRQAALACAMTLCTALTTAAPRALPPEVVAALERAQLPRDSLVVQVQEVGALLPRLSWQAQSPVNPASLTKLLTTYAALDLLGPAWRWSTPVWLDGRVHDGVLDGNLVIKGSGDPTLVIERVWLLLRRVQQAGVREIRGDIVLDRSAFAPGEVQPGDFDGEPFEPYNVQPDALLLSHKAVIFSFRPVAARGIAIIGSEPALAGVRGVVSVPLADGPCGAWHAALKADFTDAGLWRFDGAYPTSCGERNWPVAYVEPASFNARLLTALWREMGGSLSGSVHDGPAPGLPPTFTFTSPALAEVVRDINKFSNNLMAQQLFLTLALVQRGQATPESGRAVLQQWLGDRFGAAAQGTRLDNGSGLSRDTRVSAALLSRLLLTAFGSAQMSELMSSLPVSGVDGTMRRSKAPAGRAHLKTGSLRDVSGIAGYVLSDRGRRYVVVAIVNHPDAGGSRPVFDALVQWVADDLQASALPGP